MFTDVIVENGINGKGMEMNQSKAVASLLGFFVLPREQLMEEVGQL